MGGRRWSGRGGRWEGVGLEWKGGVERRLYFVGGLRGRRAGGGGKGGGLGWDGGWSGAEWRVCIVVFLLGAWSMSRNPACDVSDRELDADERSGFARHRVSSPFFFWGSSSPVVGRALLD